MHRKEPWEWALIAVFAALCLAALAAAIIIYRQDSWDFELVRDMPGESPVVFFHLSDPERRLAWQPRLIDSAALTGIQQEPGATRLLYLRADGRRWQAEERLDVFDPPRQWAVTRIAEAAETRIAVSLRPLPGGATRLVWHESVRYRGIGRRLIAPFLRMEREARAAAGLDRLAEIVAAASP